MTTTTLTTCNGKISTEAEIRTYADGTFSAAIISINGANRDVLQAENFKTRKGAESYIERYRQKKQLAAERGELVQGVKVL